MFQTYQIALFLIVTLESVALAYLADNYSGILLGCTVLIALLSLAIALLAAKNRKLRIERSEHQRKLSEVKQIQEKSHALMVEFFSGSAEGPSFGMNDQELLHEQRTNGINHTS